MVCLIRALELSQQVVDIEVGLARQAPELVVAITLLLVVMLLGLFDYGLKVLIRRQEPLLFGNRQIDDHTSDLLSLDLIQTDKLLDIFIDAIADLLLELLVVFVAGRDEMLSLQLVLLLASRYPL